MLQAKTLYHTEKQGFGYPWLSNKFQPKPAEAEPSFRKVSLPPAKLCMLLLWLTSGLESFGHKSTPSDRPWIELSKILASTKMGWA